MRFTRLLGALAMSLALTTAGCTQVVSGTAAPDPNGPPTEITKDGSGIQVGFTDAPLQIEIFTEPQCPHCAQLQHDFGDEISSYINLGELAVTYRPMTFLDVDGHDYSARVSNALFLAAGPGTGGVQFQRYVEDLWSHQQPGAQAPSDQELADMARESGVGSEHVAKIAAGEAGVDTGEMADQNVEFLSEIQDTIGTPTVYDLKNDNIIDIYDNNWLAKLLSAI
ncbi:protein-disulfide isomerase [Mycobacterium dioxanotrophicus]|jgi:protein-disulfide isomerase|uniref:Protein-disulfide isomerase n=1 Tax=Mycobacterium dioxanotrophicus TaxID=482462 RepID=A0A1Y0BZ27_9MYCO|nr:thioredoxin domain-containing protein [Mycobacterium dioxanotrophicus]ART68124.1 protein-disulfide isomerase [Mycobacterium dioxanotrophicus]